MKDLLPYLAGAASAFVVQFLVQVYVVPLVETRKRRLERWEKDVLDLGELLSGAIGDAARQAEDEQFCTCAAQRMIDSPDFDRASVEREANEHLTAARQATRSFNGQVNDRAEWLMDRIATYRQSDRVVEFTMASLRYRMHLIEPGWDEWRELSDEDFDAWWARERKIRNEMNYALRWLTLDRRALRISWRARLKQTRYKIRKRYANIRRSPIDPKPVEAVAPGQTVTSKAD